MSEGKGASVLWLLGLMLVVLLWLGHLLARVEALLHVLNAQMLEWRTQFSKTFQYIEDDEDIGAMWGDEQEAR